MQKEIIGLDDWFELIGQSYLKPPLNYNGTKLPAFPSDNIQTNTTGQSGIDTQGVGGGGALNTTFYGETFIPESYARRAYAPILKLEKFMYDPSYQSHPIMFFRKK